VSQSLPGEFSLPELEERVLRRWRETGLSARVQKAREGASSWVFYEGPPTANGKPGVHHVWARVFKDLYPRFQTMRGHWVSRKGGWDCHGLPVELEVEKELDLNSKQEIESYGIAEFNARCRESVRRYIGDFAALTERSGIWIDTDNAYWTLTNEYIESCWWLLKEMWDAGQLYEGHRISPYCGRCGTALSSHEVAQGYKDIVDESVYVRFPVLTGPPTVEGADLLVWTTTPWTLVSNVAVAVGEDIDYVRVRVPEGRDVIVAAEARERLLPDAAVVTHLSGGDLVGTTYGRPFDLVEVPDGAQRVVADTYVSTGDGSGMVHLAPAFGEDDYRIGRREDLPVLNPITAAGTFEDGVALVGGRFARDANRDLVDDLAARGVLFREEPYEHSYPHCWRCGTPLIYWAKTTWFIRTSENRRQLIEQNQRIEWHPSYLKEGRFGKWLEGNVDWALSRDRYWGTPLPVWRCEAGHDTCVGSVAELSALAGRDLSDLDLHRPYVDDVVLTCATGGCGREARRLVPVLDAWFDSGSMPSAQHHYPFEGEDVFRQQFPADFICEAIDQTRGWFYSLLAVNTLVFDSTPYRNVVCLGLLVDEGGNKMSKSRGNVVDPWGIFDELGADALRWNFLSFGQPWNARRVSVDSIRETTSQTLITLWHVYTFARTYAELDPSAEDFASFDLSAATHVNDRWILSQLDATVGEMTERLEAFDALAAATALARFVDGLSNWYVRRSRNRFWQSGDQAAHATLHHCLETVARLLAPFCPMLSDEIYVGLTGAESVHLADWPATVPGRRDEALDHAMAAARRLVALGRAAREKSSLKVRQPLSRALLLHPGAEVAPEVASEIADELNVKRLDDVTSIADLVSWTVKPNFRVLGPRLGSRIGEVQRALAGADGSALRAQLEADGAIEVAGERLTADDVELRASELASFALAQDESWAVALDTELTGELVVEGVARSLIRALNDRRKDLGLDIADRITVTLSGPPEVERAVTAHDSWIADEVLATSLTWSPSPVSDDEPLPVDGYEVQAEVAAAPG
jgi:isoleucyl-tRNA synthetase